MDVYKERDRKKGSKKTKINEYEKIELEREREEQVQNLLKMQRKRMKEKNI